jgi:AcrR family transcriptional regulator
MDATRRRILETARRLFAQKGFGATTVAEIARESNLAIPTVYKNFGNKSQLLLKLIDQTINMGDSPDLQSVLARTDPRERLDAVAAMCVSMASGTSDIFSIMSSAASSDPQFGDWVNRFAEGSRRSAGLIAKSLARDGALRAGCSVKQARDVIYLLANPYMYETVVGHYRWTEREFASWVSRAMAGSLLDPAT